MMEVNSFGAQRFGDGWLAMAEASARTWRWLLTWARVRSFTSMSSSTDLGVAPAGEGEGDIYLF